MNRLANENDFNKNDAGMCAKDIIDFLIKHKLWIDTFVYVNGKRYGCYDGKDYHYDNNWDCVFVEDDMNPRDYFDYAGDFLSMSFECGLYDVLNYGFEFKSYAKMEEELNSICLKYNKYYELGNAWNLSLYDL